MRGFSLVEMRRPAIVLNQSDAPAGRIFTLFHEYAHLLLARPGVCIPTPVTPVSSQRIETFCNRFAAALLLPQADFRAHLPSTPADGVLRRLASRYGVSRYVVLGRMQALGAISSSSYQQISRRWRAQDAVAARPPQGGGGLKAPLRCLLERGQSFVSLVVEATKRDLITLTEANTYLGVKLKDFRKLAKGA
jgi:Zn-dependent peptidase ImmA (M78 family)